MTAPRVQRARYVSHKRYFEVGLAEWDAPYRRNPYRLRPPTRRKRRLWMRRQRDCAPHRWEGGGKSWGDYGYEYEPPSCAKCGISWEGQ